MIGADIVDVLENLRNATRVAQSGGMKFKGVVVICVDDDGNWAAQCSGLDIGEVKDYLQRARDDAVAGGQGFVVIVPPAIEPPDGTRVLTPEAVPEGATKQ